MSREMTKVVLVSGVVINCTTANEWRQANNGVWHETKERAVFYPGQQIALIEFGPVVESPLARGISTDFSL